MKARRIGLSEERLDPSSNIDADHETPPNRWQFVGINELVPLPLENQDGAEIGKLDFTFRETSLEDLFRSCSEDYWLEEAFGEKRVGEFYRTLADSDQAEF